MNRALNYRKSPPDPRDYKVIYRGIVRLPTVVDLSALDTSVKDQGGVGSCTAFGAVGLYEHVLKRYVPSIKNDLLSEKFTYYATRVNIAKWSRLEDSGAYVRDALSSLVKYGSCLETTFPYLKGNQTDSDYKETPPSAAYTEALKYQALTYANVADGSTLSARQTNLTTLKGMLNNGSPFIGGFTCYENLWDAVNGVVPLPSGQVIGGHCVMFVGYDDVNQRFKFKNSWGSSWGDNGYGYLPYQYLLNGDLTDLWTILTEENNGNVVGVAQPQTAQQILDKAANDGLIAIAAGNTPQIPSTLSSTVKTNLQSFFTRVITMKGQLKV